MRTSTLLVLFGCIIAASFASYAVKKAPTFKFDANALKVDETSEKKASFGDLVQLFQTHDFKDNTVLHEFLGSLKQRIHDEHDEHLAIYTAQRTACKEEVEFRDAEIAAGRESFGVSQAHLNLCSSERTEAEGLKSLAEAALLAYNEQLIALRENRAQQIIRYNIRKQKLADAHKAINKALDYVAELELEASRLGLDHSAQLIQYTNALLAVAVHTGDSSKVLNMYNKLIQLHNKRQFDYNDLSTLTDMLEAIRTNVEENDVKLDNQEAQDKIEFETREQNIIDIIGRLNEQITLSNNYITKMDACITQETSISDMASDKVERNTELKTHAVQICEDNETEWRAGEDARHHQEELLSQLQWALDQLATEYQDALLDGADNIQEIIGATVTEQ